MKKPTKTTKDKVINAISNSKGQFFGLRYRTPSGNRKVFNAKLVGTTEKSIKICDMNRGRRVMVIPKSQMQEIEFSQSGTVLFAS